MIKAVVFDMFETLVTHYESPLYMGKQICEDIGISEGKFREIWDATEEEKTLGKKSLEEVIDEILRVNDRYSTDLFEKIVNKRKNSKIEMFEHLHAEIIPLLTEIKRKNIKIGLITNCYFEERDAIVNSKLYNYFDAVCMSCELGLAKPDVKIFEKCADDLQVRFDECIYVGDGGSYELETARSLGMHPIQAAWYIKEGVNHLSKRKLDFLQADSPMDVLAEIIKYD